MISLVFLALHAAVGVMLVRTVARGTPWLRGRTIAREIGLPLTLAFPWAVLVLRGESAEIDARVASITLPVVAAMLGVGVSVLVSSRSETALSSDKSWASPLAAATGLLLVLLAATHRMSLSVGQTFFAIFAVILWINLPEERRTGATESREERSGGLTWLGPLALAQAAIGLMVSESWLPIVLCVSAIQAALVLAMVGARASPSAASIVGQHAAVYGITLGLGLMSLASLTRTSLFLLTGSADAAAAEALRADRMMGVSSGFGAWAVEGMLLSGLALVPFLVEAGSRPIRRSVGVALVAGAAVLLGVRLSVH